MINEIIPLAIRARLAGKTTFEINSKLLAHSSDIFRWPCEADETIVEICKSYKEYLVNIA